MSTAQSAHISDFRNNSGLPEKVLQFGEGNFLRGFADWMIDRMNRRGLFNGRVVVVQPIAQGLVDLINERQGAYHLALRGILNGKLVDECEPIGAISRGINPYADYDGFLACADNPELRIILSNTTEAGIAYAPGEKLEDRPQASFPGKLTALLYRRFRTFGGDPDKGLLIIPCELIDRNGIQLQAIVLRHAREWELEPEFIQWLGAATHFTNTLVDRIVTGYPKDEVKQFEERLGAFDPLLDTAEPFHLWVIEGDPRLSAEFPAAEAGMNVIWTGDMTPYRTRKVRILNGAHTMTVPAAYLCGKDTVKECMDDALVGAFMKRGIDEEIIPTLDLPKQELQSFADAVLERFANPFIKHYLLSISLNSVSKFKTRVLPSIAEYTKRSSRAPRLLGFSLAALLAFYRGTELRDGALIGRRGAETYKIQDDAAYLEWFREQWAACDGSLVEIHRLAAAALSQIAFWGEDLTALPGLPELVGDDLYQIVSAGMPAALQELMTDTL